MTSYEDFTNKQPPSYIKQPTSYIKQPPSYIKQPPSYIKQPPKKRRISSTGMPRR